MNVAHFQSEVGRGDFATQAHVESPSLLVVSESPFCLTNGFGVTLSTLFRGWPGDSIVAIHSRQLAEPDESLCARAIYADVPGHAGRRHGIEMLLARRPAWRRVYSSRWLRRALASWAPEVVYALIFSVETLHFAQWIAAQYGCPLVAHIADDGPWREGDAEFKLFRNLFTGAASRYVISEEMRAEYLHRYGCDSVVLHNGADGARGAVPQERADSDQVVIRYLGSVHPHLHFQALEDCCEAVSRLNDMGVPAKLEFVGGDWTSNQLHTLLKEGQVVYRGSVSKSDGEALLASADLLLIPVSFREPQGPDTRLSLPTKLTEYLATGTPTLIYGPLGSAPVEFCRRHQMGNLITQRSVDALVHVLTSLRGDRREFRERAARDREFVLNEYSGDAMRQRIQPVLRELAISRQQATR